jgi:uncharacterized protein DUF3576
MVLRLRFALLGLGVPLGLAACGGDSPPPTGNLAGNAPLALEATRHVKPESGETTLGVNAYLWRGALDTLSFMPLAWADPKSGVITTDWWQPPAAAGERFKATAYILGRQLRADAIRVAIFRQIMENGQWVDSPVSEATTGEIENKVLARARELRAAGAKG